LPLRTSFPSMLPPIVLSFPFGTEPAFTPPGIDPRAAVIPITRLVIDLLAAAADITLDRATIRALVGGRGPVGTALTPTLLSPFIGHLEGAGPDPSLGRPSRLLGSDVGFGVLAIGHSPSWLHQFVVQAHGADKALSDGATVSVYISLLTPHRPSSDQIIRRGGGLLAAPVILAAPLAQLTALRSIDAVEPCSGTPDQGYHHRIAVMVPVIVAPTYPEQHAGLLRQPCYTITDRGSLRGSASNIERAMLLIPILLALTTYWIS
jgi:hypothetical protein